MDRILPFLFNHYLLSGALLVLLVAYVLNEVARSGKSVSPQMLSTLINKENARVIDVRDPAEFRNGHITGSENIPVSQIAEYLPQLKTELARPIVVICSMGQVAGAVTQQIKAVGVAQVYKLDGGISNWKSQAMPLVKHK